MPVNIGYISIYVYTPHIQQHKYMITYPVSPNARFTLYKISTNTVVANNTTWPRLDGYQIEGQSPDYVYLEHIENTIPEYDPNYYFPVKSEELDLDNQAWIITWSLEKHTIPDIKQTLSVIEEVEVSKFLSQQSIDRLLIQAVHVLYKNIADETLTEQELKIKGKIKALKTALAHNTQEASAKSIAIDKGEEIDLRIGWLSEVDTKL